MPIFHYKALDSSGKPTQGTLDAENRRAAMDSLKSQGLRPTSISEKAAAPKKKGLKLPSKKIFAKPAKPKQTGKAEGKKKRISGADKVALAFFQKLHQLDGSGLPIGDAIRTLSQRLSDPRLREICSKLWRDLSEGHPLATAIKQYPEVFDPSLVYLIEAGETTGHLAPILENIIEHLESQIELRRKVLSGLAYPSFICLIALGVVGLFIFYLLPRIEGMMASLGGELSLSARLLIGLSGFALAEGPFLLVGTIIAVITLRQWRQTTNGRYKTDSWLINIPYFKHIVINADLCRVSNLIGTLLDSGVNTTETLRLTERSLKNKVLLERFQHCRTQINDGASFSGAFRKNELFPPMGLDILSVGENTGNLSKSFKEIYKMQSEELAGELKFVTGLISSIALGFAFTMVTILTLGIVTSILQLSKSLAR